MPTPGGAVQLAMLNLPLESCDKLCRQCAALQAERAASSSSQDGLTVQLQRMRRERDTMRSSNHALQAEVERYRSHVNVLTSQGSSLHSMCTVAETTKSVTNKVMAGPSECEVDCQHDCWLLNHSLMTSDAACVCTLDSLQGTPYGMQLCLRALRI